MFQTIDFDPDVFPPHTPVRSSLYLFTYFIFSLKLPTKLNQPTKTQNTHTQKSVSQLNRTKSVYIHTQTQAQAKGVGGRGREREGGIEYEYLSSWSTNSGHQGLPWIELTFAGGINYK